MNPNLYHIHFTFTVNDDADTQDQDSILAVGVDMDKETAELLAINNTRLNWSLEKKDKVTIDDIYFTKVKHIDNFRVILVENEPMTCVHCEDNDTRNTGGHCDECIEKFSDEE